MKKLATYLKRTLLLVLLAVLGYGIGAGLRSGDSMLQAEEAPCNNNKCYKFKNEETEQEFGLCSYEEEENVNCRNVKETENCEYMDVECD